MDKTKIHEELCNQIHDTYIKKNHDYGDSFGKSFQKYGIVAGLVRMEDKWNRLQNLTLSDKQMVNDESIKDTLLDLANYCLMLHMELQ